MTFSLVLVFFIVGVLFAHRAAQVFSCIVYNVGSEQEEVAMDLGKVWVRPPGGQAPIGAASTARGFARAIRCRSTWSGPRTVLLWVVSRGW